MDTKSIVFRLMSCLFSRIATINQNADNAANYTYLATLAVTLVIYMQPAGINYLQI